METSHKILYSFASMNTTEGFICYFSEIFGKTDELYIIKGGPGTGKSRFMRELGKEAENHGSYTEYFLCSSDPSSLDGVIFTDKNGKRIGIIDGTAPHVYEPSAVGIKDHILNFGEYLDSSVLIPNKEELEILAKTKKRLYNSMFSYLSAIGRLDKISKNITNEAIQKEKLRTAVKRLTKSFSRGDGYVESVRIRSAVSCNGAVTLDTYRTLSQNRYAVSDSLFTAEAFMSALKEELISLKLPVTVSYSPLSPNVPDAIYIPSENTSVYVGSTNLPEEKIINMRRFIDRKAILPYKTKLRDIFSVRKELTELMNTDSSAIRKIHAETESIYGKAMDFEKKEALTKKMCHSFFE